MLKKMFYAVAVLAFTVTLALPQGKGGGKGAPKGPGMALSSPDFQDGGIIPDKYTQAVPMPVSPQARMDQRAREHGELRSDHARSGQRAE